MDGKDFGAGVGGVGLAPESRGENRSLREPLSFARLGQRDEELPAGFW
jgi:hypothetical protein